MPWPVVLAYRPRSAFFATRPYPAALACRCRCNRGGRGTDSSKNATAKKAEEKDRIGAPGPAWPGPRAARPTCRGAVLAEV
eukprot:2159066-Rhodomonas_salina.1